MSGRGRSIGASSGGGAEGVWRKVEGMPSSGRRRNYGDRSGGGGGGSDGGGGRLQCTGWMAGWLDDWLLLLLRCGGKAVKLAVT